MSIAIVVAVAAPSAAETPYAWHVSGGYSAMRDMTDHLTFKAGWTAGTSVFINRWLAVAAEVDRQTARTPTFDGSDFHFTSQAFLAGFRGAGRLGVFTEFGQVLIGRVNSTGTIFGSSETTHHMAIQPGLGLDFALGRRWALRGEADARWLDTGREARIVAGMVYQIR